MTTVGFDRPLYVLPFDHRGSFQSRLRRRANRLLGSAHRMAGEKTTREQAVTEIACRYRQFADIFERAPAADELGWLSGRT